MAKMGDIGVESVRRITSIMRPSELLVLATATRRFGVFVKDCHGISRDADPRVGTIPNNRNNAHDGAVFSAAVGGRLVVPIGEWHREQNVPSVPLVRSCKVRLKASNTGLCWL